MPASSPACTPSSTKTEDEDDRTMLVNSKSVWLGSKFAIRQMLPKDPVDGSRGRVVNIASIGGLVGSGRTRLLRRQGRRGEQLAVDFAAERINVNALYRYLDCVQS